MTLTDVRKLRADELIKDLKTAIREGSRGIDRDERKKAWERVGLLLEEIERRLARGAQ